METFGTDSGPPCRCGSSIYRYEVAGDEVVATCAGCHLRSEFQTRSALTNVKDVRSAHERRALDPSYWGAY